MSVTIGFLFYHDYFIERRYVLPLHYMVIKLLSHRIFWRLRDQTIVYDRHCDFLVKVQGATEFA